MIFLQFGWNPVIDSKARIKSLVFQSQDASFSKKRGSSNAKKADYEWRYSRQKASEISVEGSYFY